METTKKPTHVIYWGKQNKPLGASQYDMTASGYECENVYGKKELHYLIDKFMKDGFTHFIIKPL